MRDAVASKSTIGVLFVKCQCIYNMCSPKKGGPFGTPQTAKSDRLCCIVYMVYNLASELVRLIHFSHLLHFAILSRCCFFLGLSQGLG